MNKRIQYEWKKEFWTSHNSLNKRPEKILGLEGCDIWDCDHDNTLSGWHTPKILFAAVTTENDNELGCLEYLESGADLWVELCLVKYYLDDDEESVEMDHIYVTPSGEWYCPDDSNLMPPQRYQKEFLRFMGLTKKEVQA